jgi:DNA repair protein RadC
LLNLDQKNQLKSIKHLFSGGLTSASVDMRVLYRNALLNGAAKIVIAHNHPSGIAEPSEADKHLTKEVARAGMVLGIDLLDSIIVTEKDVFSMRLHDLI